MSRLRTSFALEFSIRELVRRNPYSISGSFTFRENLTDLGEAHRRMRNLLARISRTIPGLQMCGVWEKQSRGAWHCHWVASHPVDVTWLREAAVECGFGPQMRLQPIEQRNGFRSRGVDSAVAYCCKYLAKDLAQSDIPAGARLVFYHGAMTRRASCRFAWSRGMSRLYRLGRQCYSEVFGVLQPHEVRSRLGLIMRLGWEQITGEERWQMVSSSEVIRNWWYGDKASEVFPF